MLLLLPPYSPLSLPYLEQLPPIKALAKSPHNHNLFHYHQNDYHSHPTFLYTHANTTSPTNKTTNTFISTFTTNITIIDSPIYSTTIITTLQTACLLIPRQEAEASTVTNY
ncbi:hypothetical protein DPMN_141562 [Dreissena polymorpha]|uniref:Uncharacterized protein n=1 Tax=Dreissena polymorpha TaxID=45954 RepID=A0A9D4JMP9_DREPO|nr:hypothetical protein DPMN_141562 [Dreissena polymorpha]